MSVIIRGKKFHYRFTFKGTSHSGPCPVPCIPEGATPKDIENLRKEAVRYETQLRENLAENLRVLAEKDKEIRLNKSVLALVENYKFELTGGTRVTFREAYDLAAAKPSQKVAESSFASLRRTYWNDFTSFMEATYPDIQELSAVRRTHCEAYISYITENGRYDQSVKYTWKGRKKTRNVAYTQSYKLSHKTIKAIAGVCKWVFSRLAEDAGIFQDPWKNVVLPTGTTIDREIFTPKELRAIWEGMQNNPFCYHLFIIAANSGMTEGDICTLRWEDIDWEANCILRVRRKTKTDITLPMLPQLREYLARIPQTSEYVSPVHASMYLEKQSYVSTKVTRFLQSLGIKTSVQVEGRRARSVKDLHSMRHVFCYQAKRAGIPEGIIMRFVGHEVLAMTQHYANHDTIEDLAMEIKKLPALFAGELGSGGMDPRKELATLAYSLPLEQVERLLELAAPVSVTA